MTGLLLALGIVTTPFVLALTWHVAAERHADRVERRWRASWPALPPATGPLQVESVRVDLEWDREPVDLDALPGAS